MRRTRDRREKMMETDDGGPDGPSATDATTQQDDRVEAAAPRAWAVWRRWGGFALPIVLFLVPVIVLSLLRPEIAAATWTFYLISALMADGSAAAGIAAGFTWWYVYAWVFWGQTLLTAFLLWNLQLLRRWGPADRYFTRKERQAIEAYRRRAWMRRFHFWGLCVFTILPVGSGVYLGVLVGKVTGLADPKTWAALTLGNAVWLFLLTFLGVHFWDALIPDIRLFG